MYTGLMESARGAGAKLDDVVNSLALRSATDHEIIGYMLRYVDQLRVLEACEDVKSMLRAFLSGPHVGEGPRKPCLCLGGEEDSGHRGYA